VNVTNCVVTADQPKDNYEEMIVMLVMWLQISLAAKLQ
jgi:hypothetical protein